MNERDELGRTMLSAATPAGTPTTGPTPTTRAALPEVSHERFSVPDGLVDPELGRGGMGRVLRLSDPHLGREVAVKELLPSQREDPVMETLFVREARVLARLEHPGVVPVYEIGRRPDGTPYYAMRRIHGRSLQQVLATCGSLDDRLALLGHYVTVVQTMGYAHSHGVVHRDLKPENVMVSGFGETLVIDWGLAIVDGLVNEALTAGTPTYMAPEQSAGKGVDAQSDVWSLGVMLFELLAGRPPFTGTSASAVINLVQEGPIPKVTDFEPDAPAALVKVVERALQRDPSARFANAGDMADVLEAALREKPANDRTALLVAFSLGLGLLAVLGYALFERSSAMDAHRTADVAVANAERARNDARAEAGLAALRTRDFREALRWTEGLEGNPLGAGVRLLAREGGSPARAWGAATEAGCASLTTVDNLVVCPTLNEVLLLSKDGNAVGKLSTGPRGWQQAAVALPNHRLAAGGDDRILRIFDLTTRQLEAEWPAQLSGITALAADGETLFLGLNNGDVVNKAGDVLHHHARPVLTMAAAPQALASSAGDGMHVSRPEGEASLDRRAGAIAWAQGALLVGVERTVARLAADGTSQSLGDHRDDVTALVVLADGRFVSGGADRTVRWWSSSGQLEAMITLDAPVRALTAVSDTVMVAWEQKLEAFTLAAPAAPVWDERPSTLTVSASRRQLYGGFIDGRVRRADLPSGPVETLELRHTAPVRAIVEVPGEEVPDHLRVLSAGDDGQVRAQRWNGEVESLDALPGARVLALAVSTDGARAAWAADDGSLVLYSLEFTKEIARTKAPIARALAFSDDGRTLAVGRDDRRVALHSAETGALELESNPFDAAVTALVWVGPQTLAVGRANGQLTGWDRAQTPAQPQWPGAPRARITALATDSGRLVAGTDVGEVLVWSVAGGAPSLRLVTDSGTVGGVGLVKQALITSGTDRRVHVLELP